MPNDHDLPLPSENQTRCADTGDGGQVGYYVQGEGPTVVLVQGLGLPADGWLDVARAIAARGFEVVAVDNRGTGASDAPVVWSLEQLASDVATVFEHAAIERAIVVGVSLGGVIAQRLAMEHAQRVEGLLLVSTMPGVRAGAWPHFGRLVDLVRLGVARDASLPDVLEETLARDTTDARLSALADVWAAQRERPGAVWHVLGQLVGLLGHETRDALAALDFPVTILTGGEDELIPPENADRLAACIPQARCRVVEGYGHLLAIERPEILIEEIERLAQPE